MKLSLDFVLFLFILLLPTQNRGGGNTKTEVSNMKPVDPAEYTKILNDSPVAMMAKEAAVIGREYRIPKTELLAFISGNSSAEE